MLVLLRWAHARASSRGTSKGSVPTLLFFQSCQGCQGHHISSMNTIHRILLQLLIIILSCSIALAQSAVKREKRVYYLDCSASMVKPNQIWDEVKDNLKDAIDNVQDETTELMVIPFAYDKSCELNKPLEVIKDFATQRGKERIKKYIDAIPSPSGKATMTYHNVPITDFINYRIDPAKETYMFLMTDGEDEDKTGGFDRILSQWQDKYSKKSIYAFYVQLKGNIDGQRKQLIDSTDKFWHINTANVNINPISISEATFNVRNEKALKFKHKGDLKDLKIKFTPLDDLPFDIGEIRKLTDGLNVSTSLKPGKNVYFLDEEAEYRLAVEIEGGDPFTFLLTPVIKIKCLSKRENSLSISSGGTAKPYEITLWERIKSLFGYKPNTGLEFGTVVYTPGFLWTKDQTKPVTLNIDYSFSPDAKMNKVIYASFQFVDNEGKPMDGTTMTVEFKGDTLSDNILNIKSDVQQSMLSILFNPHAEAKTYQGYFRLIDHNLDRVESHEARGEEYIDLFQWTIRYEKKMNPLEKTLLWILAIVLICLFIWFVCLRNSIYPKFQNVRKRITIKKDGQTIAMIPLPDFKGCRMFVLTNTPVKQSILERIFIGNIKYLVNPEFTNQIVLVPANRKNFIAVRARNYLVNPNPLPVNGVGTIKSLNSGIEIIIN